MTMDLTPIVTLTGLSLQALTTTAQMYGNFFKKSNLEKFFKSLLETKNNLSLIGERDDIKRYFFSILEKVSNEANLEKLESWKNAVIHLATDFSDYGFKDNFLDALAGLTVWDLTVLYTIYSTDIQDENIMPELLEYWERKKVPQDNIIQAIKHLAIYNFVEEIYWLPATGFAGSGHKGGITHLQYLKNPLGKKFLEFVSDANSEI